MFGGFFNGIFEKTRFFAESHKLQWANIYRLQNVDRSFKTIDNAIQIQGSFQRGRVDNVLEFFAIAKRNECPIGRRARQHFRES